MQQMHFQNYRNLGFWIYVKFGVNSLTHQWWSCQWYIFRSQFYIHPGHGKRIEATLEMRLGLATKTRDPTIVFSQGNYHIFHLQKRKIIDAKVRLKREYVSSQDGVYSQDGV